jgi:iron complex outermembrane receptor protein|nr:MAG: TonB-dependent receptor [Pseudomonadota bacterium]
MSKESRHNHPVGLAVTLSIISATSAAWAQSGDDNILEEVVVTGTRVADRTRLDTLSPVDVLTASALASQGSTELATSLQRLAPSITFPRPSATDGTDSIRPATLRGLSPDQTLVLVDSKRRHASALVNLNGSVGRGSSAVDLNALPVSAIERVEVLRDGASAQYGSDAIAGVVNVRLRAAREGGGATATYGEYSTRVETARGSRKEHDGATRSLAAWVGLGLGEEGYLTLSGEYRDRNPTSRGDLDPRVDPPRVTSRYGDPDSRDLSLYANAGLPLASGWELYGWAGLQDRDSTSAALFRTATNDNNVPEIYPEGFLPLINPDVKDVTAAAGTRGLLGGWDADFSLVYGRNKLHYDVHNSLNATYGVDSPTSFDAGGLVYDQFVLNAGLTRQLDLGLNHPVNFAWGVEARRENYEVNAGEEASWATGTAAPDLAPGSQGFPGFQPSNEIEEDRTAFGGYVDLETHLTDKLLASVALRAEHYSDFGSATTGKVALRYDFTPAFALRGTVSRGFRAPSLQQQYFTSTATVFTDGIPAETGTFPATSDVARALGATDLEAEKSWNYSVGAVFRLSGFEATVDAYQIDIDDRIVLSENLSGDAVLEALADAGITGVTAARFFTNGLDTRTRGVDIVLRKRLVTSSAGRFDFTAAANYNDTDIRYVADVSAPGLPILFGRQNQLRMERGTPKDKYVLSADWNRSFGGHELGANLQATRYGETIAAGSSAANDLVLEPKWVTDLSVHARMNKVTLTLGADNLFDTYPTRNPADLNTTGTVGFSQFSPFGFNGRFLYGRASINW